MKAKWCAPLLLLGALALAGCGPVLSAPPVSAVGGAPSATAAPSQPVTALVPDVPQQDCPVGWDDEAQCEQWGGYACGAATITAILKGYGVAIRIGTAFDYLHYAVFSIQGLDEQGLHGPDVYVPLLQKFYPKWYAIPYNGKSSGYLSYDHLQRIVEAGYPVAADFWDDGSFWPDLSEGHWMTIVGFTSTNVIVRDSSTFHLDNQLSVSLFKKIYTGIAAPILPVGVQEP